MSYLSIGMNTDVNVSLRERTQKENFIILKKNYKIVEGLCS